MDRKHNIYHKNLQEQDLTGLAELCANVARNSTADSKLSDMAHSLRVECVRLRPLAEQRYDRSEKVPKKALGRILSRSP